MNPYKDCVFVTCNHGSKLPYNHEQHCKEIVKWTRELMGERYFYCDRHKTVVERTATTEFQSLDAFLNPLDAFLNPYPTKEIKSNYGKETMFCICCQRDLKFHEDKYIVDHGKRYCVFCYDTCRAGKYNKCVMNVVKKQQTYGEYDRDEHFYRPTPIYHPSYIPKFVDIIKQMDSRHITDAEFTWAVKYLANRVRK